MSGGGSSGGGAGGAPASTRPDAGSPGTASAACPSDPDLALCLTFEGAVADRSPGRLPVQAMGAATQPGPHGPAVRLRGQGGLFVGDSPQVDAPLLTLEAWVRPESLPTVPGRAGLFDRDGRYGMFILPGGSVSCGIWGASVVSAPGIVRAGVGVALACVRDRNQIALWANGREIARQGAAPAAVTGGGAPGLAVGANSPSGDVLDGLLGSVRIWRRVRSAPELCKAAPGCS
jgi:hypothetical protein